MRSLETMKTVYSHFGPEVAKIVHDMEKVDKSALFRTQTPLALAQEIIDNLGLKGLELPSTSDGKVDLDALHEPIIDKITGLYESTCPGLARFANRYPTAGSSEGIFHYLASLKAKGVDSFYILRGEYEGYGEYGKMLGLLPLEVEEINQFASIPKGVVIISNPSARDGNIISNEAIEYIASAGHEIAYDLSYVGSTMPHQFFLTNPAISTVFLSFSKPYGLFRFRIGFTYAKEPLPSLYANKWFKHINSILLGMRIAQDIGPSGIATIYKPQQLKVVADIAKSFALPLQPSDTFLLAHISSQDTAPLTPAQKKLIEIYQRGGGYRFCLTPYLEKRNISSPTTVNDYFYENI